MYQTLTFLHNLTRWLVLAGIAGAIIVAAAGLARRRPFTPFANALRHWAATIAHIQLVLGMLLYFRSPSIGYYWKLADRSGYTELRFFSIIHPACMLLSIVVLTVASAMARRNEAAGSKYRSIVIGYSLALLIMLIAIPWPFSPLASRPYWR